jgi:hypothetical protein
MVWRTWEALQMVIEVEKLWYAWPAAKSAWAAYLADPSPARAEAVCDQMGIIMSSVGSLLIDGAGVVGLPAEAVGAPKVYLQILKACDGPFFRGLFRGIDATRLRAHRSKAGKTSLCDPTDIASGNATSPLCN